MKVLVIENPERGGMVFPPEGGLKKGQRGIHYAIGEIDSPEELIKEMDNLMWNVAIISHHVPYTLRELKVAIEQEAKSTDFAIWEDSSFSDIKAIWKRTERRTV